MEELKHEDFDDENHQYLNEGTYGSVLFNTYKDERVVLKYNKVDENSNRFFPLKEFNACAILNGHPYIVETLGYIYEDSEDDNSVKELDDFSGEYCYDMKRSDYSDIILVQKYYAKLDKHKLQYSARKRLILQIAVAIEFMHINHIVHCDLKPRNVVIDFLTKTAKVIDFGASINFKETTCSLQPLTTLTYSDPEHLMEIKDISYKSDVWSLAIMMLNIMLNRPFNPNKYDDSIKLLNEIMDLIDGITQNQYNKMLKITNQTSKNIKKPFFNSLYHSIVASDETSDKRKQLHDLMKGMLAFERKDRFSMSDVIEHEYFKDSLFDDIHKIRSEYNKKIELRHEILVPENQDTINAINDITKWLLSRSKHYKENGEYDVIHVSNDILQFIILAYENVEIIEEFATNRKNNIRIYFIMLYLLIVKKINYINDRDYDNCSYEDFVKGHIEVKSEEYPYEKSFDKLLYEFEKKIIVDKYKFNIKPYVPFCSKLDKKSLEKATKIIDILLQAEPGTIIDLKELESSV